MTSIADLARLHKGCTAQCAEKRGVLPAEGVYPECVTVEAVRRVEELTEAVAALREEIATLKAGFGLAKKPAAVNAALATAVEEMATKS